MGRTRYPPAKKEPRQRSVHKGTVPGAKKRRGTGSASSIVHPANPYQVQPGPSANEGRGRAASLMQSREPRVGKGRHQRLEFTRRNRGQTRALQAMDFTVGIFTWANGSVGHGSGGERAFRPSNRGVGGEGGRDDPSRARPREARGRRGAAATAQPTRLVRAPHSRAPVTATAVSIGNADALLRPHVPKVGGARSAVEGGSAARKTPEMEKKIGALWLEEGETRRGGAS